MCLVSSSFWVLSRRNSVPMSSSPFYFKLHAQLHGSKVWVEEDPVDEAITLLQQPITSIDENGVTITLPADPSAFVPPSGKPPPKPWSRLWPGDAILLAIAVACNSDPDVHMVNTLARLMSMLPHEISLSPQLISPSQRGHMYCYEFEWWEGHPILGGATLKKQLHGMCSCHLGHFSKQFVMPKTSDAVLERMWYLIGVLGNVVLVMDEDHPNFSQVRKLLLPSEPPTTLPYPMLSALCHVGHADIINRFKASFGLDREDPLGSKILCRGVETFDTPLKQALLSKCIPTINLIADCIGVQEEPLQDLVKMGGPHGVVKKVVERLLCNGNADFTALWVAALMAPDTGTVDPVLNVQLLEEYGADVRRSKRRASSDDLKAWSMIVNPHIIKHLTTVHSKYFQLPPIWKCFVFTRTWSGDPVFHPEVVLALLRENVVFNPSDAVVDEMIKALSNPGHRYPISDIVPNLRQILQHILRQRREAWEAENGVSRNPEVEAAWNRHLDVTFWKKFPWVHHIRSVKLCAILLRMGAPVNVDFGEGYALDVRAAMLQTERIDQDEAIEEMIKSAGGRYKHAEHPASESLEQPTQH